MTDRHDSPPALTGEVLSPRQPAGEPYAGTSDAAQALALASRLARGQPLGDELGSLLTGPLRDAVTAAADYAQAAASPATRASNARAPSGTAPGERGQ